MDMKTYIAINYDSFIDNVVMELDVGDWMLLAGGGDFAPDNVSRALIVARLRRMTQQWRERMEKDDELEDRMAQQQAFQHEDWHRKLEDAQDILAEQERHTHLDPEQG